MNDTQSPSEKVVTKLAAAKGIDPTEVEPLFNSLDPDALDIIFENLAQGPDREQGKVEFTHAGHSITVRADGSVAIDKSSVPLD
jgi:hypothetical protein